MAQKEVTNIVKLQIEAGKATPAPPVGPALGSTGINIMQFTKEFNEKTANQPGMIIPVVINAASIEAAMSMVAGTARSMGVTVIE